MFKCFVQSVLSLELFYPGVRVPRARELITPVPVVPWFPLLKAKQCLIAR